MGQSKYVKRTKAIRTVATGTGASGGTTRLALNRDWLVAEHKINIGVSQANGGTDPTSVDVRDFIATVSLETSDGRRVFLTGAQAYDLGRFTEDASSVVNTLGATSTSQFAFDLHHENDAALLDLLTALRSNEFSTVDLVLTFNAAGADGFKGGTVPSAAAYTIAVMSEDYEMLTEIQFGALLGSAKHYQEKLGSKVGTAAGSQPDIDLITGNLTRFIALHAYDTSGAVATLANTIVGDLRLNINGRDMRVMTGREVQCGNVAARGFDQTGVFVLDFGDDENGWLDLRNVQQAKLQWSASTGVPAGFRVDVAQDFMRSNKQ